jgi:serine/threonine protein kinase
MISSVNRLIRENLKRVSLLRSEKKQVKDKIDRPKDNYSASSRLTRPIDPYRLIRSVLAGKYELVGYAGGGGMGAVYKALRLTDNKIVAVKILKPDIVARNPEYAELFEKEVKTAQGLKHSHIVEVFDSGKDDDLSFMVMEWIEGRSIEDVIAQKELSISSITNIFGQICSAVAFAHENKIIHLDLKPGNILLLESSHPDDFVKVIDFGLARVISKESGTTVTRFRGTHQYCAPEQFGGKVTYRSDIYSLGATLYYLLTGIVPFGTSYINAKIHPNLELPEIPSVLRQRNLPPELDNVINKALSKDPALRQKSAIQLLEEFKDALSFDGANLKENSEEGAKPNLTPKLYAHVDQKEPKRSRGESANVSRKYLRLAITGLIVLIGVLLITLKFYNSRIDSTKKTIQLKLATYWRSDFPILADNLKAMAKDISDSSNGELEIEVLFAGEVTDSDGNKIEPRDLFDAVSNNRVQMVHSASYYWESKIKGASFFSSVPFGMDHEQMDGWINDGEGLKLWRELYKPYKVLPFPCGHTGPKWVVGLIRR